MKKLKENKITIITVIIAIIIGFFIQTYFNLPALAGAFIGVILGLLVGFILQVFINRDDSD
ncbi:hypothetical protein [Staphylococcus sp. 11261D007BR]